MAAATIHNPESGALGLLGGSPVLGLRESRTDGNGPTDLVGFLHQVDLVELQDDGKVDGLLAHSTRLLVEVHLLEDLRGKQRRPSVLWKRVGQNCRFCFFILVTKTNGCTLKREFKMYIFKKNICIVIIFRLLSALQVSRRRGLSLKTAQKT